MRPCETRRARWTTPGGRWVPIVAFSAVVCSAASASAAEDAVIVEDEVAAEEVEVEVEEPELVNALLFGTAYSYHILRNRLDAENGEPLGRGEHLFGFVISYSRHVIPERLAITFSKPFLFNRERFDTPFDFLLRGLYRKNRWEFFGGLLITWNIRIFEREREEEEGERNALSFGFGVVTGGAYFFNPRWSVDLEVGYTYIPTSDIVTHEINAALSAVYHYGGLIERRRARRASR